ncbi:MAG: hypothetical protein MHM6MM_006147 [Cercozoa sp. M6MM]
MILDSEGNCHVSDLGLAVHVRKSDKDRRRRRSRRQSSEDDDENESEDNTPGFIRGYAGTPGYASPEVVQFKWYTTSTDLFSFGVLLYRLLCGLKPFDSHTLRLGALLAGKKARHPAHAARPPHPALPLPPNVDDAADEHAHGAPDTATTHETDAADHAGGLTMSGHVGGHMGGHNGAHMSGLMSGRLGGLMSGHMGGLTSGHASGHASGHTSGHVSGHTTPSHSVLAHVHHESPHHGGGNSSGASSRVSALRTQHQYAAIVRNLRERMTRLKALGYSEVDAPVHGGDSAVVKEVLLLRKDVALLSHQKEQVRMRLNAMSRQMRHTSTPPNTGRNNNSVNQDHTTSTIVNHTNNLSRQVSFQNHQKSHHPQVSQQLSLARKMEQLDRNVCQATPFLPDFVFSQEVRNLLRGLLHKNPRERLGAPQGTSADSVDRGFDRLKRHPWFRGVQWDRLEHSMAPFVPSVEDVNTEATRHITRRRGHMQHLRMLQRRAVERRRFENQSCNTAQSPTFRSGSTGRGLAGAAGTGVADDNTACAEALRDFDFFSVTAFEGELLRLLRLALDSRGQFRKVRRRIDVDRALLATLHSHTDIADDSVAMHDFRGDTHLARGYQNKRIVYGDDSPPPVEDRGDPSDDYIDRLMYEAALGDDETQQALDAEYMLRTHGVNVFGQSVDGTASGAGVSRKKRWALKLRRARRSRDSSGSDAESRLGSPARSGSSRRRARRRHASAID